MGGRVFLGQYPYNIDQKGRLAIPAKFRESFRDGLVLARGLERCILAYPLPQWMELAQRLASLPLTRSANRRLNRATFANAFDVEFDKQGRILLPPDLREWAEIADRVVVVGQLNYLEIWSQTRWMEERARMNEQAFDLAEEVDLSQLRR